MSQKEKENTVEKGENEEEAEEVPLETEIPQTEQDPQKLDQKSPVLVEKGGDLVVLENKVTQNGDNVTYMTQKTVETKDCRGIFGEYFESPLFATNLKLKGVKSEAHHKIDSNGAKIDSFIKGDIESDTNGENKFKNDSIVRESDKRSIRNYSDSNGKENICLSDSNDEKVKFLGPIKSPKFSMGDLTPSRLKRGLQKIGLGQNHRMMARTSWVKSRSLKLPQIQPVIVLGVILNRLAKKLRGSV